MLACGLGRVKRGQRMTHLPRRENRNPCALDPRATDSGGREKVSTLP